MLPPGTKSELNIYRQGLPMTLSILISDPRDELTKGEDLFSGLKGAFFAETHPMEPINGVRILEINPETPIALTELMPGDIIIAVNPTGDETPDLKSLRENVSNGNDVLLLRVIRDQYSFFVGVNQSSS